jgi:hypothetical protein
MNVGWLLDASVFSAYHDDLVAAIHRSGGTARSFNSPNPPYDWDDTSLPYRSAFPREACVVTHADIDLVLRVQSDALWTPGVFATLPHYFCSHYYAHFGRFLLNRDYVMLPFGELRRCADFLFETLGHDGRIFVRPDSPLKLFAGLIASHATFDRDLEFMAFYEFPVETLVVVSSPKNIEAEWRFVIADQAIVAGCRYKDGDFAITSTDVDPEARRVADAVLATGHAPDSVWVMDICRTSDGTCHLLEIGAFSFANLYGCDKNAVVEAVSRVAARMHAEMRAAQGS